MLIALSILIMGVPICWFHQAIYATYSFAALVMNAGKEKSAVLQGFCYYYWLAY